MLRPVVLLAAALTVGSACGPDPVDDPSRATTCTELVEAGRAVAERVLAELGERTIADLEAADGQGPLAPIEGIMRTDEFEARARALGCRARDLELQGCRVYQGLSREAHGDLARQYLAPYFQACD
jgi:hypothetical protein